MRKHILFLVAIIPFLSAAQLKKKVLFLGNSYTYVNNLPQLIKDIALSKGDTLEYDQNVVGGYTFQNHFNDAQTYAKLNSNSWDIVVIQGQSQEPSFSPGQVMTNSYPYAKNLTDSIRAVNPCTEVMFYMTWGRKNGDASNCAAYPPVCTFNGMNARLRESYLMFADSFNASCAPVGVAWKTYRTQYPAVDLYQPDESHPSAEGSYLAACVFYSSIFKKTSNGATYFFTLNSSTAQNMQQVSSSTVMDSTTTWNLNSHIPTAGFTYTLVSGNTYQFINSSVNATSFNWYFGSSQVSPQYTFPGIAPFSVTLTAANSCSTSASMQVISLTNLSSFANCEDDIYYNPVLKTLNVNLCDRTTPARVVVCDLNGKNVFEKENCSIEIPLSLNSGIYSVEILQGERRESLKILVQ